MRRRDLFRASIALSLAGECAVLGQGPADASPESRKAFLEKFPWTEMCTTPEDAMMLRILIESRGAKRGVEVGGNVGYGAINMGIGFERTAGRLYSLEIDPGNVRTARKNLGTVGLDKTVTVVEGDALKVLPTLEAGIDFVFIDALKPDYLKYFRSLEPKLVRGATVVADNVIVSARQMSDFLSYVQSSPNYDSVVIRASLHKNDGMLIGFKIAQDGREDPKRGISAAMRRYVNDGTMTLAELEARLGENAERGLRGAREGAPAQTV